jgi:hypothetical protein
LQPFRLANPRSKGLILLTAVEGQPPLSTGDNLNVSTPFVEILKEKELQVALAEIRVDCDPRTWESSQKVILETVEARPDVVARVRDLITVRNRALENPGRQSGTAVRVPMNKPAGEQALRDAARLEPVAIRSRRADPGSCRVGCDSIMGARFAGERPMWKPEHRLAAACVDAPTTSRSKR